MLAVVVAACSTGGVDTPVATAAPASSLPTGDSTVRVLSGGAVRSAIVHRPARSGAALPLVVMLHGGYGSARQAQQAYGWDGLADRFGFVVAYPDGLSRSWNAGSCCGTAAKQEVNDVEFVTSLVARIRRDVSVDISRVYVAGMSNGAMMALRLMCETDAFAAGAAVAGTLVTGCGSPRQASLLQIHGTADDRVPYAGGPGKAFGASGQARVDGMAIPAINKKWRRVDDCSDPVEQVSGAVTTSLASCADGRAVELISIAGAGHQWPGATSTTARQRSGSADTPSTAIDATETIWDFFAAHPRR